MKKPLRDLSMVVERPLTLVSHKFHSSFSLSSNFSLRGVSPISHSHSLMSLQVPSHGSLMSPSRFTLMVLSQVRQGSLVATQSLAAISQLGSILHNLQSITRQALKGLLAPSSNSLMMLGSFFLGSLAMSCITQSWKLVSYYTSYIGVNKGRIYIY